jgi:hypothetical protein
MSVGRSGILGNVAVDRYTRVCKGCLSTVLCLSDTFLGICLKIMFSLQFWS